ncbi:MAG TPA: HAD family hydrolase [Desulfobacteraceae bacterium]|nr:HAD family hydrolase [Desulfobacteraceae bacterium]
MSLKAVIFDLDGTLLDTLEDLADAGNRVLADSGLPVHPVAAYRYFVGDGLTALIRRILPEGMRNDEEVRRKSMAFREIYAKNWNAKTRLYPGVDTLLNGLQEKGLPMNVLSNKPHDFTEICVREFLGGWTFAHVLGNREGLAKKPDPAGALEIAGKLGLAPSEIIYVGDTATDMKTAAAAGMYAVGALWGFRTAEELEVSGAAFLAQRPEDVLELPGKGCAPFSGAADQKR